MGYTMVLDRNGKVQSCKKSDLDPASWYSHDVDAKATKGYNKRLGADYLKPPKEITLETYTAEEADRMYNDKPGTRYQTFSYEEFIPVRDDWWERLPENKENITA